MFRGALVAEDGACSTSTCAEDRSSKSPDPRGSTLSMVGSPGADEVTFLSECGFAIVDCLWCNNDKRGD